MVDEEKLFGLGPGRLYLAPAEVSEADARHLRYYAGPTKDGVTLSYSARIHEITDYAGKLVRSLRYGERITLTGKMSRLQPKVLSEMIGAPYENGTLAPGALPFAGKLMRVRVVLVCALPGGGEMVFSMIASATSGMQVRLAGGFDSAVPFSLTAETDSAGMTGKLVFA